MTKRNRVLVLFVMISFAGTQHIIAQYLRDFGLGGGVSGYSGDVTRNPTRNLGSVYSTFLRFNTNSRFAFAIEADYAKISGSSSSNVFPGANGLTTYEFETSYIGIDALAEVNFFPYPKQKAVPNSKNITPYAFLGIGYRKFSSSSVIEKPFAFPIGVGGRWLFGKQWGMQVQFKADKWMSDALDEQGGDAPFAFNTNALHLKDWVYTATFMLTYSFGEDIWDCNCPGGYKRKQARVQ